MGHISDAFLEGMKKKRLILRYLLSDLDIEALAECFTQINGPLVYLSLGDNNLNRLSIKDIDTVMPKLKHAIETLDLSGNALGHMDQASLVRLMQSLPPIKTLSLNNNSLEQKSVDDLMQLFAAIPISVERIYLGSALLELSVEHCIQLFKNTPPRVRVLLDLPFPGKILNQTIKLDAIRLLHYLNEDIANKDVHPVPTRTGEFIAHLSLIEKTELVTYLQQHFNDPIQSQYALFCLARVYLLSPRQNFYELAYNDDITDNLAKDLSEQVVSLLLQGREHSLATKPIIDTMLYFFKNGSKHIDESVRERLNNLHLSPHEYVDIPFGTVFEDDRGPIPVATQSVSMGQHRFFAAPSEAVVSARQHSNALDNKEPGEGSAIEISKP